MKYETDLYQPIKSLLEENGFIVNGEVDNCDLVAKKDEKIVIVELKLKISLNLILQIIKRQRLSDYVYIALPEEILKKYKKYRDFTLLLRRLGVGLISVKLNSVCPHASVLMEPNLFDIKKSQQNSKKKKNHLESEFAGRLLDLNQGGSVKKKIMTAYREKSLYIACCLEILGPLSPKVLREYGSDLKKTNSILSKNFYGWFNRVSRGLYEITDLGRKAIKKYQDITNLQKQLIKKQ